MDLCDSPDEAAFRREVREWIKTNLPERLAQADFEPDFDELVAWSRMLGQAGYAGLNWLPEYGGGGRSYSYHEILLEELALAEAPGHIGIIGIGIAGPTIMAHGTGEQKTRYLKKILTAEEIWCQGFSEPDAGSDLVSVRTRAELLDGRFVVNGQKVWSSFAHVADWCILLAVTDPAAEHYRRLSYLLVDMHSPGVEVRPLRQITGSAEFNEIYFTDVEVPLTNILGSPGDGWKVAMTTLREERAALGFALAGAFTLGVGRMIRLARNHGVGDCLRDELAQVWISLQALKWTNARVLTALMDGADPGPEVSITKLHWSESNQRLASLALEIMGPRSQVNGDDDYWRLLQLRSRGNTIEGGTSEILRTVIAERVLGLPKGR